MSTSCEVKFERLVSDGSNYSSWSAHVLNVLRTWGPSFERVVVASILSKGFDGVDESNLSNKEKECVHHNRLVIDLLSKNVSKVIWSFILTNQRISQDAHHIWHVLEGMCTNQSDDEDSDDEDQEEEDEPVEECSTSETCILSPLTSSKEPLNNKITLTDSAQKNSVVPVLTEGMLTTTLLSKGQHLISPVRYLLLLVILF